MDAINDNALLGTKEQRAEEVGDRTIDQPAEPSRFDSSDDSVQLLPRPVRRRKRTKEERGLPPAAQLAPLAAAYLERQRKLWPTLATYGLLPTPTEETLRDLAKEFISRHRAGRAALPAVLLEKCRQGLKLAGIYNRYSCDNSSPTSIIDQLTNALEKARQEERFVPWQYVFADYSVSGLDSSRQGYSSYKLLLADPQHRIETTYVDDFSRASRDEVEWWKLAHLSRKLGKRMIGASDEFDLTSVNWDLQVSLYGIFSRMFIKSLREKVARGMKGAAGRGGCLGKLPLGFTRTPRRDSGGHIIHDADGLPLHRPCIDPATAPARRLLFDLYVEKRWSAFRITRHFNQLKVDGWAGWTQSAIMKLLWSPTAIGVFVWNRTRREFDFEQEKWDVMRNPRSKWVVNYDRTLALVSIDQWKAARKRLAASRRPRTSRQPRLSRNQISASTLFSGTLVCGYCGKELLLYRSDKDRKAMACVHGRAQAHQCQLSTSKSTRIIEDCLLGYLHKHLFTEEAIERLVDQANAYLLADAKRPRQDLTAMKNSLRGKEKSIAALFDRMERTNDVALRQAFEERIAQQQRDVNALKATYRDALAENAAPPPPLSRERAQEYLADLRSLLNAEIPAAAEALRVATGPITVTQENIPSRKRPVWIVTFTPKLMEILREIGKEKKYPDSITLEFLCKRIWNSPEAASVVLERATLREHFAQQVLHLTQDGRTLNLIAKQLRINRQVAKEVRQQIPAPVQPSSAVFGEFARVRRKKLPKYIRHAAEVARLREDERRSFVAIAARLKISSDTAVRAYDHARPAAVQAAMMSGRRIQRCHGRFLTEERREQIRAQLRAGHAVANIATAVGCSKATVNYYRRQMQAEPAP